VQASLLEVGETALAVCRDAHGSDGTDLVTCALAPLSQTNLSQRTGITRSHRYLAVEWFLYWQISLDQLPGYCKDDLQLQTFFLPPAQLSHLLIIFRGIL
jgi:hypothetical protein